MMTWYTASTDTCSIVSCGTGSWSVDGHGSGSLNSTNNYVYDLGMFQNWTDTLVVDLGCGSGSYTLTASVPGQDPWGVSPSLVVNNVLTYTFGFNTYGEQRDLTIVDDVTGFTRTFRMTMYDECYFNPFAC